MVVVVVVAVVVVPVVPITKTITIQGQKVQQGGSGGCSCYISVALFGHHDDKTQCEIL